MNEEYYQMYLEELKAIRPCTGQEREELLAKAAAGDDAARERLIEGHLILALAVAKDFRDKGVPLSDLIQEANLGLTLAVHAYREGDFLAQARKQILALLQASLEEHGAEKKIEEEMLKRVNRLQEVSQKMAGELGREATLEELARRMQLPAEEIRATMKMAVDALSVTGEFGQTPAESLDRDSFDA